MRRETDAILATSTHLLAEMQELVESARALLEEQARLLETIKREKARTPDAVQSSKPPMPD
jgi:hypothetical protein